MKHQGCISDYIPQRNLELIQAYRRALSTKEFIVRHEVCTIVANTPCSRFWISEERATAVITDLFKGKYVLDNMRPLKREMFMELFKRTQKLRAEQPDVPLFDIVMLAVNSPAPKFYMTPDSIVQIIWRIRRGHYKVRPNHHVY